MNIGKAIETLRKQQRNLTQQKLAIKSGKHFIPDIEARKTEFSIRTLIGICKGLNIKLSELITKAEEYD